MHKDKDLEKAAVLDITRALDKEITLVINQYKKKHNKIVNSVERNQIRNNFYYNPNNNSNELIDLFQENISKELIKEKYDDSLDFLKEQMDSSDKVKNQIISSLATRIENAGADDSDELTEKYLSYIANQEQDKYQFGMIEFEPTADATADLNYLVNSINNIYDELTNYHFLAIIFNTNEANNQQKSWSTIANLAIIAENLKTTTEFPTFKRRLKEQKANLKEFLINNSNLEFEDEVKADELVENFYESQSYGYYFTDLFISEDSEQKVLVLQKVEYDSTNVPCPDCFDWEPRGNSYTKVLQKSFECSNPACKSRSKSGRGKRYNYLSAKLQTKKKKINADDLVEEEVYRKFRRDIYAKDTNIYQTLIQLYSFTTDDVLYISDNDSPDVYKGRNIIKETHSEQDINKQFLEEQAIPLVNYLKNVLQFKKKEASQFTLDNEQIIIEHADSTEYVAHLKEDQFGYAITSPPYYNAREYSQWPTMVCYLTDMLLSISNIYEKISEDGIYMYNIGDIVDQDNVYVPSMMSKRRQLTGLYSVLLYEIVGFNTSGNIIWDKGEVQSKRNSTTDLLPYYVKTVNCYEHIWVFSKQPMAQEVDDVSKFSPVIKISNKGENKAKHTAPYPLDLVNLLEQFITDDGRILDPYLGSGTTALWCSQKGYRCLGLEMNEEYHQVALDRLESESYNISLF